MREIGAFDLREQIFKQYERAGEALTSGDHEYARIVLRQILKWEPGCYEARGLLRKAQQSRNEDSLIAKRIARIKAAVFIELKGRRLAKHNPLAAIDAAETLLEVTGLHPGILAFMGKVALERNWNRTAITAFEAWLGLEPDALEAHLLLGLTLEQCGDTAGAIRVVQHLVEVEPHNVQALALLKRVSVRESLQSGRWMSRER